MMDVSIARMRVFPFGTCFSTRVIPRELLARLYDPKRCDTRPKHGLGMAYLKETCWIMWAFDIEDVPMALSHEFMHGLLIQLESFGTASKLENVSDTIGLGRSILS